MTSAPPRSDPLPTTPGAIVAGKYRVERVLGKGGMGVVVEARHLALEERVALKFLLPAFATNAEASARFMREARAVFKIKSEHVVRVMDVASLDNGSPYMVLEFLEGSDLLRVLKVQGVVPVDDAVDYMIQACDAIGEAHSHGIIHRDVKPSNLFLVTGRDGMPVIKVLDFGISKVVGTPGIDALTRTTTTMGSAHYMSPEQMRSIRDVDHRTDIYALGITLFTLISGEHPYSGNSIPQVYSEILTGTPRLLRSRRPDLPEHFAGVVAKAYLRDPGARYQSIAELVFALAPYAPPRSRPTIERIARLVGRPGSTLRSEPPHARGGGPPAELPRLGTPSPIGTTHEPSTIDDQAQTRLMPSRPPGPPIHRAAAPAAQLTEPARLPTSNGPVIAVIAVIGVALLLGVGALLLRMTRDDAANDAAEARAAAMSPRSAEPTAESPAPPASAAAAVSATAQADPPTGSASPAGASTNPAGTAPGSTTPSSTAPPGSTPATTGAPRTPVPSARASSTAKAAPPPSSAPPPPPPSGAPPKTVFDDR